MISSLEFLGGKDSGYIVNPKYKQVLKKKYIGWSDEDIQNDIKRRKDNNEYVPYHWREDYYKTVTDGKENPQLVKNLLNRKFEFSPDKINVLFGPNGSGKTTILKTIANYCLCGNQDNLDGYTNVMRVPPLDYGFSWDKDDDKYTQEKLIGVLNNKSNLAKVGWDGSVVYYENFAGRRTHGCIGDLVGSLFDQREEFLYLAERGKMSEGQNSIYLLSQLIKICENIPTREQLEKDVEGYKKNDAWYLVAKNNFEYIKSFGEGNGRMTLLLDEVDKSMDICNVLLLYKDWLPKLQEKYNIQIIIVSHSPLMLSNIVQDNDKYNFISLDKRYTREMKELYKGIKF